jgi:hypothetical protein
MGSEYDVFEIMPDGGAVWKCAVQGIDAALREVTSLAEQSKNEFRAIQTSVGEVITCSVVSAN